MLELGSNAIEMHRQLGKRISDSGVRVLVTVGPMAGEAGEVARRSAAGVEVHTCDDVDQAADRLSELLSPRDVLLVKGSRGMGLERVVESIKAAMSLSTALKG
jgi:UDP-N-acetylmuramoyl-tripeptide--D-alanyl-D-alanine ligase